jgi:hypothetical protein
MMTPNEVLLTFLRRSLGAKRDRVLDFVARPKAHDKFLALLHHELGALFDPHCVVRDLPPAAWSLQALRFRPAHDFGTPVPSLRAAFDELGQAELAVTMDGRCGFWRDETHLDSRVLVQT